MKDKEALKLALEALESFVQPDSCEHGFWWEDCPNYTCEKVKDMKAITAIKEALAQPEQEPDEVDIRSRLYQRIHELETQLAQPEQEPVAVRQSNGEIYVLGGALVPIGALLYTTPPQRTWVGLTDEEIAPIIQQYHWLPTAFVRAVEAKLKEKNT